MSIAAAPNSLPTIIAAPGDYCTRDGRRVTVREVRPAGDDTTVTAFRAVGSIWRMFRGKMVPRSFNIWHVSGRASALNELPTDIIAALPDTAFPPTVAGKLAARTISLSAWNYTDDEKAAIVRGHRNQYGVSVLFNDGSRVLVDGASVKLRPCDIPTREAFRKRDWRLHPGLDSYIGTALEDLQLSGRDDDDDRDVGTIYTLTPQTYERLKADYIAFKAAAGDDATAWIDEYGAESFGSDFHMTRVGHGVGYWDRASINDVELHATGERLTAACEAFRSEGLYLGDDGEAYAS